jgi:drug/metabolite transporter (DMT)-like permease
MAAPTSKDKRLKDLENNPPIQDDSSLSSEDEQANSGSALLIAFVLMLIMQLGNRIFGKLQTYPMYNYPLFMNMLSVMIYVPLCFTYIIPMMRYPTVITPEQRQIPQYKFAVMGGYDSISGIMQMFAVNYIKNSGLIVLVQQSAIPISMLISKLTLNSTYTKAQYTGAAIVLMGIVVVLIPNFTSSNAIDEGPTPAQDNSQLGWIAIMVVSCVPMCLSSVYKEKALGEIEINIVFLNGWVAVYQLLLAIPLSIPSAMAINLPLVDVLPNMYGGWMCWMGHNTITDDYNPNHLPLDDCSMAPFYVTTYLVFNIAYNYLIVVILKHGSANILWMASTVIVPLSNVAFSLKFMPNSQPLKFWDILGLLVIMSGLVVYRFMPQLLFVMDSLLGRNNDNLDDDEDRLVKKKLRIVSRKALKKQVKYIGLNQMEYLNAVVDSRVVSAQKTSLTVSAMRIRGSFLMKIGIPPSPHISIRSPGGGRRPQPSPLLGSRARSPMHPGAYGAMIKQHSFAEPQRGIAQGLGQMGQGLGGPNVPFIPTIGSSYIDSASRDSLVIKEESTPLLGTGS